MGAFTGYKLLIIKHISGFGSGLYLSAEIVQYMAEGSGLKVKKGWVILSFSACWPGKRDCIFFFMSVLA